MHEYSLIRALFAEVDKLVATPTDVVIQVNIQIGPLAGVEPMLLSSAFDDLAPDSSIPEAQLVINEVGLTAKCLDCDRNCEVKHFQFRCPHCHATRLRITGGDAVLLEDIVVETRDTLNEVAQ